VAHLASHLSLTQDNQINSESSKIDMAETTPKATVKHDLLEQNRLGILEAE
jgi:hypothetical protein